MYDEVVDDLDETRFGTGLKEMSCEPAIAKFDSEGEKWGVKAGNV